MNNKKFKIKNCKGGYTLIELLFYIALFAVLSLVVINSMIVMTKSFKETNMQASLMKGGDIMERMSREVRRATGINSISASSLILNTKDSGDVPSTMQFLLSSGNLQLLANAAFIGNLNTSNVIITTLSFAQITTNKGTAVKISLTIQSNTDTSRFETFYNTVVLRGDY